MRNSKVDIESVFHDFHEGLEKEDVSSSFYKLAELFNYATSTNLGNKLKFELIERVKEEVKRISNLHEVIESLKQMQENILHISSIGEAFDEDEIFSLVFNKLRIDLSYEFACELGVIDEDFRSPIVEENLREIYANKKNVKAYNRVLKSLRKHQQLPIEIDRF